MDQPAWQLVESFGMRAGPLADRTALVTGGARGIGAELAHLLGRLGANVAIADLRPEGQAVAEATVAEGHSAAFIECDLAVPEEVARVAGDGGGALRRVEVLVNGAVRLVVAPAQAMPIEALLAATGFGLSRTIETGTPRSVLEAIAIENA